MQNDNGDDTVQRASDDLDATFSEVGSQHPSMANVTKTITRGFRAPRASP
jgi:hypothetical protein